MGSEPRVVEDPTWGFHRLDPLPEPDETARFYESHYYDLIRKGKRAPELARLLSGGPDADRERAWLRSTLYADILAAFERYSGAEGRRALDVGCGLGEFVAYLAEAGWASTGTEPASEIAMAAQRAGLDVRPESLDSFARTWRARREPRFSAVSALHVLEHVPDPVSFLGTVGEVVAPSGLLALRVPNDFNELQLSAQRALKKEPWWIAIPDHVNYFSFQTLGSLLARLGWEVLHAQADFPMELFLLMGEDYVGDPETGKLCHEKRRRFEMTIPAETRRRWYRALAAEGLGRNCLIIARRGRL